VTLLLACLLAAAFMAGLSAFVGAVHYPLFARVGVEGWTAYHRAHGTRTTAVVAAPMAVHLATALVLAAAPPDGVGRGAAAAGAALAAGTWALTAIAAALHGRIGADLDPRALRALLAVHHARTALWSAHAILLAVMIDRAAG
jgi:hypothetical protein